MTQTLPQLLARAAAEAPGRGVSFWRGPRLGWPDLLERARSAAGAMRARGLEPGTPVLLLVHEPRDFLVAFWGLQLAGAVAVPLSGPRDGSAEERRRVARVAASLGGPVVVDRGLGPLAPGAVEVDAWLEGEPLSEPVARDPQDPALVQFSSGSTREPRGVVLTHANLVANVGQMAGGLPVHAGDVFLSWMPLFHDMGLIGCHLLPVGLGCDEVRMAPTDAMTDPLRWLEAAARHRATALPTTPFAMDRVNRRIDPARRPDLSAVRVVGVGAEPISPEVLRSFSRLTGVPETAHYPIYGLAEASAGVSATRRPGTHTRLVEGRPVTCVGEPLPGVEVRVTDEADRPLPDGAVGHVQVRGPNTFAGYWQDPAATEAARCGAWVRTGDLGSLVDGVLAITGRHKDVICVGGRNLHAHDVEAVAEAVGGVRPGNAVAVADTRGAVEALAVLMRIEPEAEAAPVLWAVRDAVQAQVGVPCTVLPLDRVPRTTSGKKQRQALAGCLARGELDGAVGNTKGAVRALVEQVLGRSVPDAAMDRDLREVGLDSVQAAQLLGLAEARWGIQPDHRLLVEGGSISGLARAIERHRPEAVEAAGTPVGPVAIVAAACRLPGAADLDTFWANVAEGRVFTGPPPPGRWAEPTPFTGGFVELPPVEDSAEARATDPQQRLVLALADELLRGVQLPDDRRVGVFVGAGQQAWMEHVLGELGRGAELPPGTMAGNLLNMLAARLAHTADLRGPALTVDTACSASLVAVHLAVQSLQAGECTLAIAGGGNLNLSPTAHRLFAIAGALSPSGRCRPFSDEADGMVPGEGAGLVLLEPLAQALARGDPVLGVVLGSAVNNDGASLGVMAPNPAGQERVIRAALARAGVDSASVGFVEAHGTGTPIGDPVERGVLRRAYPHGPRIGAVKGLVGHLLAAAGVAGLLRALGELGPGERGAVSSFGFGGTNAHLVLQGGRRPAGRRAAVDTAEWVHLARPDPAGGLAWRPCPRGPSPLCRGGRYLVTGGTGGVGRVLCRHLVREHEARLVIVGRRAPDAAVAALLEELGTARYLACDLGDAEAAAALVAEVGPVDGVFHLAGTVGEEAARAKRAGLEHLEGLEAGFWCLFSSISAVLPGLDRGIEPYARANAFLDAWAERRRDRRAVSVAWPPFESVGMAADFAESFRARGIRPVPPEVAMAALEHALGSGERRVVVLRRPPEIHAAPRVADLRERLRELIAVAAGVEVDEVGDATPLPRLGLDSVAAVDLVESIGALLERPLPTTLLFENDTLDRLVAAPEGGATRSPAAATETEGVLPSQQTFLVQKQYFPTIPGDVLLAVSLDPPQARAALERALERVVRRHDALRSRIVREGAGWRQVWERPGPTLRWTERVEEADLRGPFDLASEPPLRVASDGRRLALCGHHAVVDARSLKNVVEDLVLALRGELPPLVGTWAEAARALAAARDPDTAWWEARYEDGVPPLHLDWLAPVDAPTTGPVEAHHEILPADLSARVAARARGGGTTLPAFVLASYLRALFLASGQHDLVVRVAQGRREVRVPDVARLVGSFADSLPVRVALDPAESLEALAVRVQGELHGVQAHAASSAMALAGLSARTAAGPVGLTPAGFSFPNLDAPETIGDVRISEVRGAAANGFTRLGLIAWVFAGRLHLSWNFPRSHLGPGAVEALARRHRELLEGEPVLAATLHGRIIDALRAHPDAPAVVEADATLTCGELEGRSALLADTLRGERIAVLARPGADAAVALLGVMRAGAAWVPLDPAWPDERIAQVAALARVQQVVVAPGLEDRARDLGEVVVVPRAGGPRRGRDATDPQALAWVMFTSGSTGRPKGVMVCHRAALAFQDWCLAAFGVSAADRFVWTSSIAFGGVVRQLFTPLLAGGSTHPVPEGLQRDPDAFVAFLGERRITVYNSVPSLWMHLAAAIHRAPGALDQVRWILLGGEAVPAAPVREWRARHRGRARLANLYGATETVVNATWHEVARDPDGVHTPIGRARSGVRVLLLDERGRPAQEEGEIVVSGAIAEGYLFEPELTAAAFVEVEGFGRAWRTGDLARRLPDGSLVYLGRRDDQVQVRGNRVEPAEIEHALLEHPQVSGAAVALREVAPHENRLVAWVTGEADPAALRGWLAARLPAWMVPHRIETQASLPRTAAGKLDRRALPGEAGPQELLAAAWAEVLGLSAPPGPEDDFFALGGDSLLLLDVLDRLRPRLAALPSPLLLTGRPRLREMAEALGEARKVLPTTTAETLTTVQRGFWLAHQADPDHPPLWCARVPLRGPVDPDAFARAVAWLARRHPALRTVVDAQGHPETTGPLPRLQVDELEALPPSLREAALEQRWAEEQAVRPDLAKGPLVRVRLCLLGEERAEVLVTAHHIVADAWSAWLVLGELLAGHDAFARGAEPPLPPPTRAPRDLRHATGGRSLVAPRARRPGPGAGCRDLRSPRRVRALGAGVGGAAAPRARGGDQPLRPGAGGALRRAPGGDRRPGPGRGHRTVRARSRARGRGEGGGPLRPGAAGAGARRGLRGRGGASARPGPGTRRGRSRLDPGGGRRTGPLPARQVLPVLAGSGGGTPTGQPHRGGLGGRPLPLRYRLDADRADGGRARARRPARAPRRRSAGGAGGGRPRAAARPG